MLSSNKYFSVEDCTAIQARYIQLTLLFTIGISLIIIYLTPYKHLFELFHIHSDNGCPLLTFTGVPCPMCGMGRVFSCITSLKFTSAIYYNPLGLLCYFLMGIIIVPVTYYSFRNKRIKLQKSAQRLWLIPVAFLLIMWLLNILYGHHHL
jgi:hypothetical protein